MQAKKSNQKPSYVVVGNDCVEDEISTGLSLEDVSVKIENEEKKELEHVLRGDKIPTSPKKDEIDLIDLNTLKENGSNGHMDKNVRPAVTNLIPTKASDLNVSASAPSSFKQGVGEKHQKHDESKMCKFLTRASYGFIMIGSIFGVIYSGHFYICVFVALCQIMLFRELVTVRYNAYFHIIQENIPLFRTTQWLWFFTAVFYTYSDFVVEIIKSNTGLHYLLKQAEILGPLSFAFYAMTFVTTIATMQIGHIGFQLNQLSWTIVVLCLTVGQMKYIMHNVYNGLIWFTLPAGLVVANDTFAYFAGMTCGRKFIRKPFISLSPNKTWEGFIGGAIGTLIFGWYGSRYMASLTWLTCPTNEFSLIPDSLSCELDPIFYDAKYKFSPQVFEILPGFLVRMIPGIVELCSIRSKDILGGASHVEMPSSATVSRVLSGLNFENCVSGEKSHIHHHFELALVNVLPVQFHALALGLFASLVAPFGGFLASGIKRAYGLKDFNSIIPGHGGVMDRLDCQFLMALYTWVHYNAFIRMGTISVPKMLYIYNLLSESEQAEFLDRVTKLNIKP